MDRGVVGQTLRIYLRSKTPAARRRSIFGAISTASTGTKLRFIRDNRSGHLNLDTATSFAYHSSKQWLERIQRQGSATEKADYSYDDTDGRLTKMLYGNGARSEYAYYASGALSKISHYDNNTSLIASVAYKYDKAGNVTRCALDDSLTYHGDATVTYAYDDLHRLTRENCAPAQGSYRMSYYYKYWYDAVGNRTKMEFPGYTWTYSYTARNELASVDLENQYRYDYEYNLRGNQTRRNFTQDLWDEELEEWYEEYAGCTTYQWSSDDKMTKVEYYDAYDELTKSVEYQYDIMGRRVAKKVDSGNWRSYFYDGLKVIAEGTGTSDKTFYTLSPGAIGGIISRDNNGTKYWYHYDRLGNVMAITDSNGNLHAGYTMEAFGNVLEKGTSTGYSSEHGSDPQPYHLTTKEFDPDAGLYYFNARWYDPGVGRLLSVDKSESLSNRYAFVDNSPANNFDPDGHMTWYCKGRLYTRGNGILPANLSPFFGHCYFKYCEGGQCHGHGFYPSKQGRWRVEEEDEPIIIINRWCRPIIRGQVMHFSQIAVKHDLMGRRVAKNAGSGWRWYFYDGLQVETEGTGQNDKTYYTHSPAIIGGIIARDANGTKYWYHNDRLQIGDSRSWGVAAPRNG